MSDQQLAVARTTRGESSHLSKAARQVVPPFLQKLYEIVNDSRNDELIKWSEGGDSFYVLNHERFAREVLGRWFKHQKFTSFVRQLNMYGFHKIPHLQQGVLRSDSDTEPWHFEHPHFHRGQPDLLCLIQRKKQPPHGMPEELDVHEPAHIAAPPLNNLTNGQVLDINSVVSGIAAIKRHQQAISADLNDLKTSNQQLWQEALAARERHKKHQDTINRILKFLAGVFGHTGTGQRESDGSPGSPPRVVIPRKRQRLMIQGVEQGKGLSVQKGQDEDDMPQVDGGDYPSAPFASISTPDLSVRSPSLGPTETLSPAVSEVPSTYSTNTHPIRPADIISRSSTVEPSKPPVAIVDPSTSVISPADTSVHSLTSNQPANDQNQMWSVVQQMMSSPSSMQKIMQALASQQTYPMANLPDPSLSSSSPPPASDFVQASSSTPSSQQVMMYDPNAYDFSRFQAGDLPDHSVAAASPGPMLAALGSPLQRDEEDTSAAALAPLLDNATRLQKSYHDAADIESDVDALQLSINSLIEGLGLDPGAIAAENPSQDDPLGSSADPAAPLNGSSVPGTSTTSTAAAASALDAIPTDSAPDFDFENFFNELSARTASSYADMPPFGDAEPMGMHMNMSVDDDADANPEQLAAFLDDVSGDASAHPNPLVDDLTAPPPSVAAAQEQQQQQQQQQQAVTNGKKRKSDAVELPAPLGTSSKAAAPTSGASSPKSKRKR